jgi:dethiobiotin synthetase
MQCICVLGTDTEIGKTFVSARLARALVGRGRRVGAYKPAASGAALGSGQSDADLLHNAAGLKDPIERVCPQCFLAPLAPPLAARLEGRSVDEALLLAGAQWWQSRCDVLLIEGAGGVLSPISERWTCLDLALRLADGFDSFRVLLVSEHRLGMVNQVLMAIEAIQVRQLPLLGIFINQRPPAHESPSAESRATPAPAPSLASNIELLERFAPACKLFTDVERLCEAV